MMTVCQVEINEVGVSIFSVVSDVDVNEES